MERSLLLGFLNCLPCRKPNPGSGERDVSRGDSLALTPGYAVLWICSGLSGRGSEEGAGDLQACSEEGWKCHGGGTECKRLEPAWDSQQTRDGKGGGCLLPAVVGSGPEWMRTHRCTRVFTGAGPPVDPTSFKSTPPCFHGTCLTHTQSGIASV